VVVGIHKLIPLRQLLLEIVTAMKLPDIKGSVTKPTVFEDNNRAIAMAIATATTVKLTPCTKHIAVKYHFFKSHINDRNGISLAKGATKVSFSKVNGFG
jgi:hypothetical protein